MTPPYFLETYVDETREEWQNFVQSNIFYNVFQTSTWAIALRKAGLKTLLLVMRDRRGGIVGGLLGTYDKYSLFTLNFVPIVYVTGGPLVYNTKDTQLLQILLRSFDEKVRQIGALKSFIRSPFPIDEILVKQLNHTVESNSLPCTIILDLSKSIEELWKAIDKGTRRQIRNAERIGVMIEEAECIDDLLAYYQACKSTGKRLNAPIPPFNLLKSVWENLSRGKNVKLFLAKYENKVIAGCIVLKWLDKMWAWHRASLKEYWHVNANPLLDWHRIKWGHCNQVKIFDLLGVPCGKNQSHPKYGLYVYKRNFGGKIVRQGEYTKHHFPLKALFTTKVIRPIYARFFSSSNK